MKTRNCQIILGHIVALIEVKAKVEAKLGNNK